MLKGILSFFARFCLGPGHALGCWPAGGPPRPQSLLNRGRQSRQQARPCGQLGYRPAVKAKQAGHGVAFHYRHYNPGLGCCKVCSKQKSSWQVLRVPARLFCPAGSVTTIGLLSAAYIRLALTGPSFRPRQLARHNEGIASAPEPTSFPNCTSCQQAPPPHRSVLEPEWWCHGLGLSPIFLGPTRSRW